VSIIRPRLTEVHQFGGYGGYAARGMVLTNAAPPDTTPLGAAFWAGGMYFDARDYPDIANDSALTATMVPRIGTGVVTPTASPVMKITGMGGKQAIQFTSASQQRFSAHWLAALMNGVDKPCTVVVRFRRVDAASQTLCGWGRLISGTTNFWEVACSAGGTELARKSDGATLTLNDAEADLQFVDHVVSVSTDGSTADIYLDGVLSESGSLDTGAADINQFRFGASGRSASGTGFFGGLIQVVGVSPQVADATQHADLYAGILANDAPIVNGTPVLWLGDAITLGSNVTANHRELMFDWIQANLTNVDMSGINFVGSRQNGSFADNDHSGYGGYGIVSVESTAAAQLGAAGAFPNVLLTIVMAGTSDVSNVGYTDAAAWAAYASLLETIHDKMVENEPTARICVSTIPPRNPAVDALGAANAATFNAGLKAASGVWDDFDTAHPSNTLIRVDVSAAFGDVWSSPNYLDVTHLSNTGYALAVNDPTYGYIQALGAHLTAISA
jgi:hypothetical protein